MGLAFGNKDCLDPLLLAKECEDRSLPVDWWFGKANLFKCSIGWQSGDGMLLMRKGDFDQLDIDTLYDLKFASKDDVDGRAGEVTIKNLVIVKATCATPGWEHDPDAPYAVEVKDKRWLYKNTIIDKGYNLRDPPSGDLITGTLNSGTAWTWDAMGSDLWSAVGTSRLGTWPGLPFTPDGQPEGFEFWQMSALEALGFFLRRLGCDLRWNPQTDIFDIVQIGADDSAFDSADASHEAIRCWDEYPNEGVRGRIYPEFVRVCFRKMPFEYGESPWYGIDVSDPTDDADDNFESGTYVILYDDLIARYTNGSLQNSSDLSARADERAEDFYRQHWRGWDRLHKVYIGAISETGFMPGKKVAAIAWEERGAGLKTSVIRHDRFGRQDFPHWGPEEPETCTAFLVDWCCITKPDGSQEAKKLKKFIRGKFSVSDDPCGDEVPCDSLPGGGGGGGSSGGSCSGLCKWTWSGTTWIPSGCAQGCMCSVDGATGNPPPYAGTFPGQEQAGICIPLAPAPAPGGGASFSPPRGPGPLMSDMVLWLWSLAHDAGWDTTPPSTVLTGESQPAALSADQNNYAPTLARILLLTTNGAGARTITGIAGGAAGYVMTVQNIHGADNITLSHNSGSSSAANRMMFNGGLDRVLTPGLRVTLFYNTATDLWYEDNP